MKFVFNDSLTASISASEQDLADVRFVPSGIILEKKVVTSATINNVDELFNAIKGFKTRAEVANFLKSNADAQTILKDPNNMVELAGKMSSMFGNSSNTSSVGDDPVAQANQMLLGGADQVGEAASKYAPYLSQKDQIIARLKPFMSDVQIGEIFKRFLEEIKLPFTEVIGILEFCIQQSRSSNTNVKNIIDFYLEHYSQKRQGANTKRIIETACTYHKLNPTVDIFSVLRDSVAGNQPKVNLGYLSKDPDAQLVFNNLIMLSQANLPEQSEEIRRRFQSSRDALQNQQQKVNMQRAIYDMMKTEEMNLQLSRIIGFFGDAFKGMLTQPMFRALKNMFYDLRAGGIIMNQATSIFGADTSPEDRRQQYHEQQTEGENVFSQIPETKQPYTSYNQYNFLKLASPEVTKHIYAQTAPQAAQPATTPTPEQKKEVENGFSSIMSQIKKTYDEIVAKVTVGAVNIFSKIKDFFDALYNAFKTLLDLIRQNKLTPADLEKQFSNVISVLTGQKSGGAGSIASSALGLVVPGAAPAAVGAAIGSGFTKKNSSLQNIKISQRAPQTGTTYAGGNRVTQYIYNATGLIAQIGTIIASFIYGPDLVASMLKSGDFSSLINGILPFVNFIKNNILEMLKTFNFFGGQAPQSNMFLDNKGNLTASGAQMLANYRETMIALGASDEDAMIFGRFTVQKVYYMEQLRTKESNLKSAESQAVQTGNPNSPETTVGDLPADFQNKLKDFLDFCRKIEVEFKANINLFSTAVKNTKNFDQAQKIQAEGLLAQLQKDLIEIQSKISEWSSMKNIAGHMMRKRVLLQKLKPLQTQLDTLKKLGIPISNIIASPNGILAQVGRIRNEEQQALDTLRKEYYEKIDLLKNPDKIAPLTKYPTNTGVTKLPESPDQSVSSESPFNTKEDLVSAPGVK
jgi:hypothetical protein